MLVRWADVSLYAHFVASGSNINSRCSRLYKPSSYIVLVSHLLYFLHCLSLRWQLQICPSGCFWTSLSPWPAEVKMATIWCSHAHVFHQIVGVTDSWLFQSLGCCSAHIHHIREIKDADCELTSTNCRFPSSSWGTAAVVELLMSCVAWK